MSISQLLTTELFWNSLKWSMVALAWSIVSIHILNDYRHIKRTSPKKQSSETALLLKIAHNRVVQLWGLLSLLIVIDAANDIHRTIQMQMPVLVAEAPLPQTPNTTQTIQKIEETTSPPKDALIRPASIANMPYTDIIEFNEKNSKEQAYIDWLKERYEGWLVTYYYLHACGKTNADDLNLIRISLHNELLRAQAATSVEPNILTAAQGSYDGLYREIPCDSEHLAATQPSYATSIQQLRIGLAKASNKAVSYPPTK